MRLPPRRVVLMLACLPLVNTCALSGAAAAPDWSLRRDSVDRGALLLGLLCKIPNDAAGMQTLIDQSGLALARRLATSHARKVRTWQSQFVEGRLLLRSGKVNPALAAFNRALTSAGKVQGRASDLLGWVGQALVSAARPRQARRILRRWLPRRPSDAAAVKVMTSLALARRDLKSAARLQGQLIALRPGQVQLRQVHARMLKQLGELDQAVAAYTGALKQVAGDSALECQLLNELGQLQDDLEQFDAAVKTYRKALELATVGGYVHRELQQRILRNYQRRRAHAKLETEARAILARQPKHRMALRLLADRLGKQPGKTAAAVKFYERYLKVVPSDTRAREAVMFMLVGTSEHGRAVPHARALYRANTRSVRRLLEYTGLLARSGDKPAALVELRTGILTFDRNVDALQVIVSELDRLGDRVGARAALDKLLEGGGKSRSFYVAYGRLLWTRKRFPDAVTVWRRLLGKSPSAMDYEQWVEVILSVSATRQQLVRKLLVDETRNGLKQFPAHGGLSTLGRRLGITPRRSAP